MPADTSFIIEGRSFDLERTVGATEEGVFEAEYMLFV